MGNDIAKEERRREDQALHARQVEAQRRREDEALYPRQSEALYAWQAEVQRKRQAEALHSQQMEAQRISLQSRFVNAPAARAATAAPAAHTATTAPAAHAATAAPAARAATAAPAAYAATTAPAAYAATTAPAAHAAKAAPAARAATTAPAARADTAAPAANTTVPTAAARAAPNGHDGTYRFGLDATEDAKHTYRYSAEHLRSMSAVTKNRLHPELGETGTNVNLDATEDAKHTYRYTGEHLRSMSALTKTRLYSELGETETNVNENLTQPPPNNNMTANNAQMRNLATQRTQVGPDANVINRDFGIRGPTAVNNNPSVFNGNFKPSPKNESVTPTPSGVRIFYNTSYAAPSTSTATFKDMDDGFVFVNNNEKFLPSAPREHDLPRSRNMSRNRADVDSDEDGTSCATCHRPFTVEIYQCDGGHSVCESCRTRGVRCAACGGEVLAMRNHQLEELIRERRVECPNTVDGCSLRPRRVDMPAHLQECIFRVMDCPMAAVCGLCTWKGKRQDMMSHFVARHHEHCQANVNQEMMLRRLDRDDRIVHLVPLDNYLFLVHIKISEANDTLSLAVQLIGTASGAGKWAYAVNIYNRAEPRRKLDYQDACTPEGADVGALFAEARCLVLPLAYVRGFAGREGVTYKLYVTRAGGAGRERARARPGRGGGRGGGRGMSR